MPELTATSTTLTNVEITTLRKVLSALHSTRCADQMFEAQENTEYMSEFELFESILFIKFAADSSEIVEDIVKLPIENIDPVINSDMNNLENIIKIYEKCKSKYGLKASLLECTQEFIWQKKSNNSEQFTQFLKSLLNIAAQLRKVVLDKEADTVPLRIFLALSHITLKMFYLYLGFSPKSTENLQLGVEALLQFDESISYWGKAVVLSCSEEEREKEIEIIEDKYYPWSEYTSKILKGLKEEEIKKCGDDFYKKIFLPKLQSTQKRYEDYGVNYLDAEPLDYSGYENKLQPLLTDISTTIRDLNFISGDADECTDFISGLYNELVPKFKQLKELLEAPVVNIPTSLELQLPILFTSMNLGNFIKLLMGCTDNQGSTNKLKQILAWNEILFRNKSESFKSIIVEKFPQIIAWLRYFLPKFETFVEEDANYSSSIMKVFNLVHETQNGILNRLEQMAHSKDSEKVILFTEWVEACRWFMEQIEFSTTRKEHGSTHKKRLSDDEGGSQQSKKINSGTLKIEQDPNTQFNEIQTKGEANISFVEQDAIQSWYKQFNQLATNPTVQDSLTWVENYVKILEKNDHMKENFSLHTYLKNITGVIYRKLLDKISAPVKVQKNYRNGLFSSNFQAEGKVFILMMDFLSSVWSKDLIKDDVEGILYDLKGYKFFSNILITEVYIEYLCYLGMANKIDLYHKSLRIIEPTLREKFKRLMPLVTLDVDRNSIYHQLKFYHNEKDFYVTSDKISSQLKNEWMGINGRFICPVANKTLQDHLQISALQALNSLDESYAFLKLIFNFLSFNISARSGEIKYFEDTVHLFDFNQSIKTMNTHALESLKGIVAKQVATDLQQLFDIIGWCLKLLSKVDDRNSQRYFSLVSLVSETNILYNTALNFKQQGNSKQDYLEWKQKLGLLLSNIIEPFELFVFDPRDFEQSILMFCLLCMEVKFLGLYVNDEMTNQIHLQKNFEKIFKIIKTMGSIVRHSFYYFENPVILKNFSDRMILIGNRLVESSQSLLDSGLLQKEDKLDDIDINTVTQWDDVKNLLYNYNENLKIGDKGQIQVNLNASKLKNISPLVLKYLLTWIYENLNQYNQITLKSPLFSMINGAVLDYIKKSIDWDTAQDKHQCKQFINISSELMFLIMKINAKILINADNNFWNTHINAQTCINLVFLEEYLYDFLGRFRINLEQHKKQGTLENNECMLIKSSFRELGSQLRLFFLLNEPTNQETQKSQEIHNIIYAKLDTAWNQGQLLEGDMVFFPSQDLLDPTKSGSGTSKMHGILKP